jgi:hypothetical protein
MQLIQLENVKKHVLFVYSIKGFTKDAIIFLKTTRLPGVKMNDGWIMLFIVKRI